MKMFETSYNHLKHPFDLEVSQEKMLETLAINAHILFDNITFSYSPITVRPHFHFQDHSYTSVREVRRTLHSVSQTVFHVL